MALSGKRMFGIHGVLESTKHQMSVGDWMTKRSVLSPDKTAIVFEGHRLSYLHLNERINRVAHFLVSTGIKRGDRVAVFLANCHEFLEIYFAVSKVGAIFVPLNVRLAPPEIEYQLNDSGSRILFFMNEFREIIEKISSSSAVEQGRYVCVGPDLSDWAEPYKDIQSIYSPSEPLVDQEINWNDPQMIMYTSGTTGQPKGVLMSHNKTLFNTLNAVIYWSLTSDDVMLVSGPLFHSGGLNVQAVPTLYMGGTVVIQRKFEIEEVLRAIEQHRVTTFTGVSTMYKWILEKGELSRFDLSSLKICYTGGEPVPLSMIEKLQEQDIPLGQLFGQTETSILLWLSKKDITKKAGSVGKPIFHGEVRIVNSGGEDVRPGEIGEIIYKGPIQMMGYWNRPEDTRETIRDGWLHTGDLATIDEDGYASIVDRKKDMYISGGENVYPAEIERVLAGHSKIMEVAIVGLPDAKWGEVGKAFVRLKDGERMNEEEVIAFCRGRVANYKIPRHVEFLNEMPKTARGKIRKVALLERAEKKE
jgi:fatty-acyl-CoA synthase